MWHELIGAIDREAICHPPATTAQLVELEVMLGVSLPDELSDLLREMNGVNVVYSLGLVWSTDEIAQRNEEMRGYLPSADMLFFGDRGNGDLFGFPITSEGVQSTVVLWDHEDNSRSYEAATLRDWLQGK